MPTCAVSIIMDAKFWGFRVVPAGLCSCCCISLKEVGRLEQNLQRNSSGPALGSVGKS